jgi:hypothetical protein
MLMEKSVFALWFMLFVLSLVVCQIWAPIHFLCSFSSSPRLICVRFSFSFAVACLSFHVDVCCLLNSLAFSFGPRAMIFPRRQLGFSFPVL